MQVNEKMRRNKAQAREQKDTKKKGNTRQIKMKSKNRKKRTTQEDKEHQDQDT